MPCHAGVPLPEELPGYSPDFNPYPSQDFNSTTCSDASAVLAAFPSDARSAVGTEADKSEVGQLLMNTLNNTATGILVANLTSEGLPVDLPAAFDLTYYLTNQLYNDTAGAGDQWAQLFSSINFTAVGEILTNISTPLDYDQMLTVAGRLASNVDITGVGYFLGNVTDFYDQRNYGTLLNNMLATVNMTQVGEIAEALPSVVTNFPLAGTYLGNIITNANFTEVGDAVNRNIAAFGTVLQGCVGNSSS